VKNLILISRVLGLGLGIQVLGLGLGLESHVLGLGLGLNCDSSPWALVLALGSRSLLTSLFSQSFTLSVQA